MTQDTSPDSGRLDALEMRVAHQDAVIEDLNAALTAQWKAIDLLTREVESLRERAAAVEAAARPGEGDERPPHW